MEFFITGTGTGIGKTFVTALMAHSFTERGMTVGVLKWVSTGAGDHAPDIEFIKRHVPLMRSGNYMGNRLEAVYCLEFPASPHLAAEMEDVTISLKILEERFAGMCRMVDVVLVEGAGGLMVPVTRRVLLADLVQDLCIPSLVVAASGLGTINHTLLTIESLKNRGIPCAGIVMNSQGLDSETEEHPLIIKDNIRVIEESGEVKVAGLLPRVTSFDNALDYAGKIVQSLLD